MEKTENQLKEAKVVIDQVKAEVEKIQDPGPLKAVMDGMVKWMALTTSIQENTASVMLDGFAKANKKVIAAAKVGPEAGQPSSGGTKAVVSKVEVLKRTRVRRSLFRLYGRRKNLPWSSTRTWVRLPS
jgi:hypothetical protein